MGLEITKEEVRELFRYENGKLFWVDGKGRRKAGAEAGHRATYREDPRHYINFNGSAHQRSKFVWIYHNGPIPEGMVIDHINRDSLDDRIENLRACTRSQNQMNRRSPITKKSGLPRGVKFDKSSNKFRALIHTNGKYIHLGMFLTPEEAGAAYKRKAVELYGEFYCAN